MIVNKIISLLLLIVLTPILLISIIIIIIIIDDGYPVIFSQKRIGINKICFNLYKLRSMKKDTADIPSHLLNNDIDFFTRIGPFIRRYSIDEIPQLFNIFIGDMNFIGPRPALYNQNDLNSLRAVNGVSSIKPGITGWAQINGRDNISIKEKVNLDKYYLDNKSIILDLKIIIITFFKVFKAENVK